MCGCGSKSVASSARHQPVQCPLEPPNWRSRASCSSKYASPTTVPRKKSCEASLCSKPPASTTRHGTLRSASFSASVSPAGPLPTMTTRGAKAERVNAATSLNSMLLDKPVRSPPVHCSGSFRAAGIGSGMTSMPSSRSASRLLARGLAADAALLRPRRSGCGALPRRSARRRLRCCASTWRSALQPAACATLGCARPRMLSPALAAPDRFSRGADGHALRSTRVAAQRALDSPRSRWRWKSSSEANQPSKPWPWAQRRSRTFMRCAHYRQLPLRAAASSNERQRPARQFCSHSRPISVLASVTLAARGQRHRARLHASSTTSRNSPSSSARSPCAGPRANQISMPSVE